MCKNTTFNLYVQQHKKLNIYSKVEQWLQFLNKERKPNKREPV